MRDRWKKEEIRGPGTLGDLWMARDGGVSR